MSRARVLADRANQNTLAVETSSNEVGVSSASPRSTLDVRGEVQVGTTIQAGVAGVVTATSFSGSGANLTGLATTETVRTDTLTVAGVSTLTGVTNVTGAANFASAVNVDATTDSTSATTGALIVDGGLGVAKNVYIGAGLSVAGTLTYEDVTSVDSVGLITAKSGVNVTGGQVTVGSGITMGIAGVATFSGTSDVHLHDNVRLNVGDASDLSIYHNGSHSYIEDSGTGRLIAKTSYFEVDNAAGNEAIIEGVEDGAVNLYYNGTKKFETTTGGIKVTGNDGVTIVGTQDNSADLFFNADGGDDNDDKWYLGAYAGGPFKLLNYASGSWETNIEANGNGNVELYFNDSKKLETTNDGVNVTGIVTATSKVQINTPTTSVNEKIPLLVKSIVREEPAICIQGPNANGYTWISDAYVDGESQASLGLSYSSSSFLIGNRVGVSTTADNTYVSLTDAFAFRPSAIVLGHDADIHFRNDNTSGVRPVGTAVTLTDRMVIKGDGDVGIGTDDPALKLHLHSESSNATFAHFTNTTTGVSASDGVSIGLDSNEDVAIYNYESSAIRFATGGLEKARFDSSGRLLVNQTAGLSLYANGLFQVSATDGTAALSVTRFSDNGSSPYINLGKSRSGTVGTYTIVQDGDRLGQINFTGADGTDLASPAAGIAGFVDGTPGSNDMPGRLVFTTASDGGVTETERLRITSTGSFQFSNGALTEKVNITAGKLSDNTNIDLADGMVHYFTTQETTTCTPNIRVNSSVELNDIMTAGDVITVTLVTTAAAGGYSANILIDSQTITEEWVGGSAPSAGGSDGLDIYVYTIICTHASNVGDSGFKVIANLTNAT